MTNGTCEMCATPLPEQKTGRPRKFCPAVKGVHECRELNDAITRLETRLAPVTARLLNGPAEGERVGVVQAIKRMTRMATMPVAIQHMTTPEVRRAIDSKAERIRSKATLRDHQNLVEIRYRLFCLLGDEVPRPHYPKGHVRAGQFIKRNPTVG